MTSEQGRSVAARMGAIYMECSSKEMNGVEEIFDLAIDTAVGRETGGQSLDVGASTVSSSKRSKKQSCKIL